MSLHIETNEDILINTSIQNILEAFKSQKEKYNNTISSLHQNINDLSTQNKYLQDELAKSNYQINLLKNQLNSIHSSQKEQQFQPQTPINPHKLQINPNTNNTYTNEQLPITFKTNNNNTNSISNNEQYSNFLTDKVLSPITCKNITNNNTNVNKSNFISSRINQTSTRNYKAIRERNNKHYSIQQRINSLKSNSNSNINNKYYLTTSNCKEDDNSTHDFIMTSNSFRKGNSSINYQDNSQHSMRSKQFQLTNKFIQECKLLLNATNYEKLMHILKEPKKENNKYKIYNIINGNRKLIQMFETIYM